MTAQVIQFPRQIPQDRPRFGEWLTAQVGGRWCVRKVRTKTWRGLDMSNRVQLLDREYVAFERRYEALYGPIYPVCQ